jgi:SAM-dependent methyltransferase
VTAGLRCAAVNRDLLLSLLAMTSYVALLAPLRDKQMRLRQKTTSIVNRYAPLIGSHLSWVRQLVASRVLILGDNNKLAKRNEALVAENLKLTKDNERLRKEREWAIRDSTNLREELRRAQLPHRGNIILPPQSPNIGGLCELMNPARYQDDEWLALHNDLERYSIDKHCFWKFSGAVHRKAWEWTHCLYGLRQLGMLKSEHRAIGVGVGRECVIFYLADHISHVIATDSYGEGPWSNEGGGEADLTLVEEAKGYCPETVDFSKISFVHQDGTDLSYASNTFDFSWSLSSIEHFGGHNAAQRALLEMARVVRPGGIVAVATEMLMLEEHSHPEYFTRGQIMTELVEPCASQLQLVSEINFNTLPFEYLIDSMCFPHETGRIRRHVVINDGNVQWTSILLFFRKREN